MLRQAASRQSPRAIVEALVESTSSFPEECGGTWFMHREPMNQLTGPCGVRASTHASSEVAATYRFIEDGFRIGEGDSLDLQSCFKPPDSGCLSVLRVVEYQPGTLPA